MCSKLSITGPSAKGTGGKAYLLPQSNAGEVEMYLQGAQKPDSQFVYNGSDRTCIAE